MSTVFVSDLHLQGVHDPVQRAFVAFVDRRAYDELVVVGDLFDLWLVPEGVVPLPALPVVSALHRAAEAGHRVVWLGGNHDPAPRLERLGIQGGRRWDETSGGRRVVAVHGDDGLDEGWLHSGVQRALRSRRVALGARLVGVERVWRLGQTVSALRRERHDAAGLRRALALQDRLADHLLHEADAVVLGHTHAPGVRSRPGGELVNLGDWYEHRTFARLDAGRITLFHWNGRSEVEVAPDAPRRRPELITPPGATSASG